MEQLRVVWVRLFMAVLAMFGLGSFAACAANAQPTMVEAKPVTVNSINCRYQLKGPLPTSTAKAVFSPWTRMHPHTFRDGAGSYVEQCKATVGTLPWLTAETCKDFGKALQEGRCAVVQDVNYIDLDVVRGRRDGKSTAFLYEAMRLKEQRQAIFVQLPDHKWLGMFAGESGKSCNNFFALQDKPLLPVIEIKPPSPPVRVVIERVVTPPPPAPPAQIVYMPERQYMIHTGPVGDVIQYVPVVTVGNCCSGCNTLSVGGIIQDGSDLQSSGKTSVDW